MGEKPKEVVGKIDIAIEVIVVAAPGIPGVPQGAVGEIIARTDDQLWFDGPAQHDIAIQRKLVLRVDVGGMDIVDTQQGELVLRRYPVLEDVTEAGAGGIERIFRALGEDVIACLDAGARDEPTAGVEIEGGDDTREIEVEIDAGPVGADLLLYPDGLT